MAGGAAEQAWGEILSDYPRGSYILATKLFWPMADDHAGGLSAAEVHPQIDASLARLHTDYVDLYQCHRFDAETPIEETMEALSEVVRAGKARFIGFSEWTPEQIRAALEVAAARSSSPRSRSTACCGAARSATSSSSVTAMGSARSSGRHWRREC